MLVIAVEDLLQVAVHRLDCLSERAGDDFARLFSWLIVGNTTF